MWRSKTFLRHSVFIQKKFDLCYWCNSLALWIGADIPSYTDSTCQKSLTIASNYMSKPKTHNSITSCQSPSRWVHKILKLLRCPPMLHCTLYWLVPTERYATLRSIVHSMKHTNDGNAKRVWSNVCDAVQCVHRTCIEKRKTPTFRFFLTKFKILSHTVHKMLVSVDGGGPKISPFIVPVITKREI